MEDNVELQIKLTQTDLMDKNYIFRKMARREGIFSSSLVNENSGFISKLQALNSYTGGGSIVVKENRDKEKVEETKEPEEIIDECQSYNSESKSAKDNDNYNDNDDNNSEKWYNKNNYCVLYGSNDNSDDDFCCDEIDFDESEDYDEYFYDDDYDCEYEEDEEEDDDDIEDIEYDKVEPIKPVSNLSANQTQIEFNTTGKMSVSENIIKITYDELDMMGYGSISEVNILLDTKNRDIITIRKENFMRTTLTLEKNKKSVSSFDDNISEDNIELVINTLEMTNQMTRKGGAINLLYTIEANGGITEMIAYSLSAQRIKNGK